jgi:hypothetical protein
MSTVTDQSPQAIWLKRLMPWIGWAFSLVVLLTGYLGGAISQYVRLQEPYPPLVPLTTALCAWFGLWLREERRRRLLPLRRRT